MIQMTQEDVVIRLTPHHESIRRLVYGGFDQLHRLMSVDEGKLAAPFANQTRSSALHSYIVDQATTSLSGFDHHVSNRVHLFQLADVALRFKKLGTNGLPCNIRTKHSIALCNGGHQLSLFENVEPLYLTVGYEVEPGWTGLKNVVVLCMAGPTHASWSYNIPVAREAIPIQGYMPEVVPPLPVPTVIPKAKVTIRKKNA